MHDVGISRGNGVRGLLPVSRQTINYLAEPSQNACFYWRFAELNAIAVTCRLGPCVAVRRRSSSRANLRDYFVGAEFGAGSECHYFLPAGTFCFNSSNQFTTTLICAGGAVVFSIRNFWPSAVTS
jgi:hypothetical protein